MSNVNGKNNILLIIVYCALIFPFIGTNFISNAETFLKIYRCMSAIIITFLTFNKKLSIKFDSVTGIFLSYSIYQIIISMLNGTLSTGILFSIYFQLISLIFLQNKILENDYNFIYALCLLYNIILLLNIPSLIEQLQFTAYNRNFLIGGKNALAVFCIPSIYYNYLSMMLKNRKINLKGMIFIVIAIFTPLIGGSSTGFIASVIVIICVVFRKVNIKINVLYFVYVGVLLIMLNANLLNNIPIINSFITETLNKDLTFTGRTFIWNKSLFFIKNNFLGYGRGNNLLLNYFNGINECHNIFLQVLLDGGIISLILFLLYFFKCQIFKGNFDKNSKIIINVSKLTIFSLMIIGLTESIIYKLDLWWILLITSCLYKKIEKGVDLNGKNNDIYFYIQ